jgi:hypothetical protein
VLVLVLVVDHRFAVYIAHADIITIAVATQFFEHQI